MMKLSPTQRHVLQRLAEGWRLAHSRVGNHGHWLEWNDETEGVKATTLSALLRRKLIAPVTQWWNLPIQIYSFTETGRKEITDEPGDE